MDRELLKVLRRKFAPVEGVVSHEAYDFLYEFGDVASALMYGTLFVPEFVEVEESVLIRIPPQGREQQFSEAKKLGKMKLSNLEASFNFVEVPYLFLDRHALDEEDFMLAEMIARAWRAHLKLVFPDRTFVVSVLSPDKTASVVGVQFFEAR